MNIFTNIVTIVSGTVVLFGFICGVFKILFAFMDGQKALLRATMLETYYKYKDVGEVPEYELTNFWHAHDAYKSLGGNSFIDDISEEVKAWSATR